MKLYYHKTDGGAEYLMDTFIKCKDGHKEGKITDKTKYVVRIDGDITKDAEITIREDKTEENYIIVGSDNYWYASELKNKKQVKEAIEDIKKNYKKDYGREEWADTLYVYKISGVKEIDLTD